MNCKESSFQIDAWIMRSYIIKICHNHRYYAYCKDIFRNTEITVLTFSLSKIQSTLINWLSAFEFIRSHIHMTLTLILELCFFNDSCDNKLYSIFSILFPKIVIYYISINIEINEKKYYIVICM